MEVFAGLIVAAWLCKIMPIIIERYTKIHRNKMAMPEICFYKLLPSAYEYKYKSIFVFYPKQNYHIIYITFPTQMKQLTNEWAGQKSIQRRETSWRSR